MMREDILSFINTTLQTEGCSIVDVNHTLRETGLDSFGYIILWMALEERYGHFILPLEMSDMDYDTTTIKEIIDRICNVKTDNH